MGELIELQTEKDQFKTQIEQQAGKINLLNEQIELNHMKISGNEQANAIANQSRETELIAAK